MKRTGIVLSLMNGDVIGKIETSEKAGIYEFGHYTSNSVIVNAFNARLSFSKASVKKAERANAEYFDTIYHYNIDTDELES